MTNHDKHYLALGLQRGATQEEIHSAFRQVAKLYHPDKDASLDAEMRYHEARIAYDVLRKVAENQPQKPPNPTAGSEKGATCGAGWNAYDSDKFYEVTQIPRLAFTPINLPRILIASFKDYFDAIFVVKIFMAYVMFAQIAGANRASFVFGCTFDQSYFALLMQQFWISFLGFLILRYYLPIDEMTDNFMIAKIGLGAVYSLIFGLSTYLLHGSLGGPPVLFFPTVTFLATTILIKDGRG